jgi:hypothetical protein
MFNLRLSCYNWCREIIIQLYVLVCGVSVLSKSGKRLSRVFQGCHKGVTRVSQGCHEGVTRVHKGVTSTSLLQGCHEGVTRVSRGCHEYVTKV